MEENRKTDENGKHVVRVPIDDPYAWVKGEVREIVSLFGDLESIAELGDPSIWVRTGERVKLEFLPCSLEDRVFHKAGVQVLGMDEVNEENVLVIDFLDQYLCSKDPLFVNKLVK
ncbi:hypothetical protein PIB30_037352 [Stylosanthes scabra]|uniref:Uncharacterized protein n=1 Tax=Stylosanthes scabra TaxID=79078 RepID=A0ABU6SDU0_9FABA|nr:hypothetical protein [Stylosanthes scabra]